MKRLPAIAFMFVALLAGGTAQAKGSIHAPYSERDLEARISGDVRVVFHGDGSAGCAVRGFCGYSGVAIWRPSSGGELSIEPQRVGRMVRYSAVSNLNGGPDGVQSEVVQRMSAAGPSGSCADAGSPMDFVSEADGRRFLTLRLDVTIAGRCAGPIDGDLVAATPHVTLPVRRLLNGNVSLDLRGRHVFANHGFAGTVDSTVVVRLVTSHPSGPIPRPPHFKPRRFRLVTEHFSVVSATGGMQAVIDGARDATLCSLLDSCGAHGTVSWNVMPEHVSGGLVAVGPPSLPDRAFRVALGVEPGKPSRRITVYGGLDWDERGAIRETLSQAGSRCSDAAPLFGGSLGLGISRQALTASYSAQTDLRTRCPGPQFDSYEADDAVGSVARRALRRSRITLHLSGGSTFSDDGYTGRLSGSLGITLRRSRITQQVLAY